MANRFIEYLKYGAGRPPGTMWAMEESYFEWKHKYPNKTEHAYLRLTLQSRYPLNKNVPEIAARCNNLDAAILEAVRIDFGDFVAQMFKPALEAFPLYSMCGRYRALSSVDTLCYGCRNFGDLIPCHKCRLYWKKDAKYCQQCGSPLTATTIGQEGEPLVSSFPQETTTPSQMKTATGRALLEKEDVDEAIELPGALYDLGLALHQKGELAEAMDAYRRAIALQPDYADLHLNLGAALYSTGDLDGAIREYKEALRIDPGTAAALSNLGIALLMKGELGAAEQVLVDSLRIRPHHADTHAALGRVLEAKNDLSGAVREFQEAVRVSPDDPNSQFELGRLLAALGDLDGALEALQFSVVFGAGNAAAHYELGQVLLARGKVDDAETEFRTCLRLNPSHAHCHLELGHILEEGGKLNEALEEYGLAVRFNPYSDKMRRSRDTLSQRLGIH